MAAMVDRVLALAPHLGPSPTSSPSKMSGHGPMSSASSTASSSSSSSASSDLVRCKRKINFQQQLAYGNLPGQPVSVARRNARERNRVKQVNNGFSNLRQHIPFTSRNKKMSKVETLKCAVEYIRGMQIMLEENGGYHVDLTQNVSSSSPMSSLLDDDESLIYEASAQHQDNTPTSSSVIVDEYGNQYFGNAAEVSVLTPTSMVLQQRQGSSLSPGYSDRSSNSPATASEVTSTGYMGVFAAAAAGLVCHKDESAMTSLGLKKEMLDEEDVKMFQKGGFLQMDAAMTAADVSMMETNLWWELEQSRRMQQQQHTA